MRKYVFHKTVFRKNGLKSWSGGPDRNFWQFFQNDFGVGGPRSVIFGFFFSIVDPLNFCQLGKNVFFEKSIFRKNNSVVFPGRPNFPPKKRVYLTGCRFNLLSNRQHPHRLVPNPKRPFFFYRARAVPTHFFFSTHTHNIYYFSPKGTIHKIP